jgi:TolB-like protein
VLGQVQNSDAKTRILVHLIRLPEQTHLWVARMDRSLVDPLAVESEVAQTIAKEFSERVVSDVGMRPAPPVPGQ